MERKSEKRLFSIVMYLSFLLSALFCAGVHRMTISGTLVQGCYSLVIAVIFLTLLHSREEMLWHQIPEKLLYLFSFSAAVCLLGIAAKYPTGLFWMLPLVIVGRLTSAEIKGVTYGVLMAEYLCNVLFVNPVPEKLLYALIMGAAILLLLSMMRRGKELPYVTVILAALCLILQVLECGFQAAVIAQRKYEIVVELSSLLFLLLVEMALDILRAGTPEMVQKSADGEGNAGDRNVVRESARAEETAGHGAGRQTDEADCAGTRQEEAETLGDAQLTAEESDRVQEKPAESVGERKIETLSLEATQDAQSSEAWITARTLRKDTADAALDEALMEYLKDDHELLAQLRADEELYQHSYEISRLSGLAAREIGCDEVLAGVAGMYHEAGRLLEPENYMEGNRMIAEWYHFPARLAEVIRQHNTGSETPQSPEAAIVMLSDCIVSTAEYLKKNGKQGLLSHEKLVRSIVNNRREKGSLSECGLSELELSLLEQFYMHKG